MTQNVSFLNNKIGITDDDNFSFKKKKSFDTLSFSSDSIKVMKIKKKD